MKVGDKIEFYVFSVLERGTIVEINKDKTLPKRKKEVPPWYILKK